MDPKKKKIRTELRKKHDARKRQRNLTREYASEELEQDAALSERISGKGELTRHRTVSGERADEEGTGLSVHLDVDESSRPKGRVLSVYGLTSTVRADDGQLYHCATRRLLKTLSTDQRHVVAAGDRVLFRPGKQRREGVIERVEPRRGSICRTQPRPAAHHRHQRRPGPDHRQRRRAAAEAEPDRPPPGDRRTAAHPAGRLHQQDRSRRSRRACSRWWASTARWATRCCCSAPRPASASSGCAGARGPRERRGRPERRGQVVAA